MSYILIFDLTEDKALDRKEMKSVVGGKMPRGTNRYVANGHYAENGFPVPNPYWRPGIIQPGGSSSHDFGENCVDDPSNPCPGA
jgi:hypothetical protein